MIFPDRVPPPGAVAGHYDELDIAYRRIWGEHVHHGYWNTGGESPAEAADALASLVAQRLSPRAGERLLDIGCGYGATAAFIAQRDAVEVVGITLSQAQLAVAQSRHVPGLSFIRGDWLDNSFNDAGFDRAYAIESTEHMADKARFFAESWRVLRPGGRLVVCAWLEGDAVPAWQSKHLLKKICSEGQLPSMGSQADYEGMAAAAGLVPHSFEDISARVQRTWWICLRRLAQKLLTDPEIRRLALSPTTKNRSFILSIPRLIMALGTGAMRYGVFVWDKRAG